MNGLDVSLAMIPPNHDVLDPRLLEAEAAGLLDRMLAVLQDNSRYRQSIPHLGVYLTYHKTIVTLWLSMLR